MLTPVQNSLFVRWNGFPTGIQDSLCDEAGLRAPTARYPWLYPCVAHAALHAFSISGANRPRRPKLGSRDWRTSNVGGAIELADLVTGFEVGLHTLHRPVDHPVQPCAGSALLHTARMFDFPLHRHDLR